jgi:hypothetical protein
VGSDVFFKLIGAFVVDSFRLVVDLAIPEYFQYVFTELFAIPVFAVAEFLLDGFEVDGFFHYEVVVWYVFQ